MLKTKLRALGWMITELQPKYMFYYFSFKRHSGVFTTHNTHFIFNKYYFCKKRSLPPIISHEFNDKVNKETLLTRPL